MTQETQNAEPNAEVRTTTVTEAAPTAKKVELIPYYLHVKQSEIQARLGNLALEACRILHKSLHTHSPRSPAFEKVAAIMQRTPIYMADFMQLEEAIDIARKTANKELYGVEEPNAPAPEATEVVNESAQSSDSTERASA